VSAKPRSALARRRPGEETVTLTKKQLTEALSAFREDFDRRVDERVADILKKAVRPLQRTGGGVFGDIPVEDLEYAEEEADAQQGKLVICRLAECGKLREANGLADMDARRESGKPSDAFCWCGWGGAEKVPTW